MSGSEVAFTKKNGAGIKVAKSAYEQCNVVKLQHGEAVPGRWPWQIPSVDVHGQHVVDPWNGQSRRRQ
ncbi:unnamed protein product [Clonostachys solani]|uniref:Uncharacterized protein n=1 Tax=Clonostachys solani TaxID=160281 RepID=A0A9N9ZBG8_9HYPO|nr:unnamed protein product [Clonostachys solani]